jgi:hypothetical protein
MYLLKATLHTALFAVLAAAAPSGLEARQGGFFVSVGLKYSGPGCVDSTLIFADPIFGNGNVCQPLDRSGTGTPIISYETVSVSPGCSGMFKSNLHVKQSKVSMGKIYLGYQMFSADDYNSGLIHRTKLWWHSILSACGRMCNW